MKPIEILVSREIPASAKDIYEILNAEHEYYNWWPFHVKNVPRNCFEFSPLRFVTIRLKKIASIPNTKIKFEYLKGPFRGQSNWILQTSNDHSVTVSYQIKLTPANRLIGWIASTKNFKEKHKSDINKILVALENTLQNYRG